MSNSPAMIPSSNELGLERTHLAYERTMMAWIRTSVSLISFGFSVYKFFDYFQEGQATSTGVIGPRRFAMIMISTGIFALVAAVAQHWWAARMLHKAGVKLRSLASVVAALVAIVGVLALTAVILRQ